MKNARVLYTKQEGVAYITLNRPEVLNALDLKTHETLKHIWDDFESDPAIRVGVLAGAGDKAFSVGQDLKELCQHQVTEGYAESTFGSRNKPGWPRLTERLNRVKPLIAKVQGYALGGGFELALACDIIIVSDNATFALPETKLGLIAGAGGLFRLARCLPHHVALGYLMTGRSITADKALSYGLVNEVVPQASLDACVTAWVNDILASAPLSIQVIKEVIAKSAHLSLEDAFQAQYDSEALRQASIDAKEGVLAFVEKRKPIWHG